MKSAWLSKGLILDLANQGARFLKYALTKSKNVENTLHNRLSSWGGSNHS